MDTLTIGKFEIPLYGIFFYLGIVIAVLVAWRLCKRASIEGFDLVASAIYVFIGAIAGAKLLFLAVSWKTILELQLPLEAILKGGFVFYGGFFGRHGRPRHLHTAVPASHCALF